MVLLVRALVLGLAAGASFAQDSALKLDPGPSTCGALADLDGDGDLDLVIGQEDRPLVLLTNDGKGGFSVVAGAFKGADGKESAEGKVSALAAFDVDGDRDVDLLVGSRDKLTRMWRNEGKRGFVDASEFLPETRLWVSSIATGDLDGDGDLDAVIAGGNGDALVFRNEKGARFVAVEDALPPRLREVTALVLADIDGDKDLDVLFGQRPDASGKGVRNRAARNDGKGKFSDATEAWMPLATYSTMGLALADVDGNGTLDLVCANRGVTANDAARSTVHRFEGGKFLANAISRFSPAAAISQVVAAGDVDGNGDVDLVFGNEGPEALYLNESKKTFVASTALPRHQDDTRALFLADVDGDRDLDIVTINYKAVARCYLNAGAGQFASGTGGAGDGGAGDRPPANSGSKSRRPPPGIESGKYASRARARQAVSEVAPRQAIDAALRFLADQQEDNGEFRVTKFAGSAASDPPLQNIHGIGVTALALLCFLAEGSHPAAGDYAECVKDGLAWLLSQQQPSGLMGPPDDQNGLYDHAMATLAIAEACVLAPDGDLLPPLEKAVAEIERRRNRGDGGFGYPRPDHRGEVRSDASVTACCTQALIAAHDAGVALRAGTPAATLAFLRNLTGDDGRTGYDARGGLSSRFAGERTKFPAEQSEAMTGAAMFVRLLLGDDPAQSNDMLRGIVVLTSAPPKRAPQGYFDPYAWFHVAHALAQIGGPEWQAWRAALHDALLSRQRADGDLKGSWDPDEPWGSAGGRFASTALATLALQAEYRFKPVVNPLWRKRVK